LRAQLDERGFLVVPGLVPRPMCEAVLRAIAENYALDVSSPESWYRLPSDHEDIVPMWGHPAQWEIRQLPAVFATFREVWGRDDLTVSLDRCRFTPPWRPGRPEQMAMHWDLDPRSAVASVQGLVALVDADAGQGFRCSPRAFLDDSRWPIAPQLTSRGESWEVSLDEADIEHVALRQGDLLVWHTRLPHSNSTNLGATPRVVQYLLMRPASPGERAETAACWATGECHPAWRHGWPGHKHREPWAPVPLSALGRTVAGLSP
jgi:hypothetical protein